MQVLNGRVGCAKVLMYFASLRLSQDMDKDTLKGEITILEEKTQDINVELGVLADPTVEALNAM